MMMIINHVVPYHGIIISLGCSQALISLDVQFLRQEARYKISEYLDNLSYEYTKVSTGLDILLQKAWAWANSISGAPEISAKDKTLIISLIANIYNIKWQLLTNRDADAIHRASTYAERQTEELEKKIEVAEMHLFEEDEEELEEEENNNNV
jgi:hypothetical protein